MHEFTSYDVVEYGALRLKCSTMGNQVLVFLYDVNNQYFGLKIINDISVADETLNLLSQIRNNRFDNQ